MEMDMDMDRAADERTPGLRAGNGNRKDQKSRKDWKDLEDLEGLGVLRGAVLLLAAPCLLASCAAMKTAYLEHNCNYDAAYEVGRNASRELDQGKPTGNPASILQECPESSREQALRGYRDGMSSGRVVIIQPQPFGGAPYAAASSGRYRCTVKAFTSTFEESGPSQLAAEQSAKAACAARYHAMHCDQVECRELP
jgi:hypothetical protein